MVDRNSRKHMKINLFYSCKLYEEIFKIIKKRLDIQQRFPMLLVVEPKCSTSFIDLQVLNGLKGSQVITHGK